MVHVSCCTLAVIAYVSQLTTVQGSPEAIGVFLICDWGTHAQLTVVVLNILLCHWHTFLVRLYWLVVGQLQQIVNFILMFVSILCSL